MSRGITWPSGSVYLAGPMRGRPEFSFPAFFAAEAELAEDGVDVYNPARADELMGFKWRGTTGHETAEFLEQQGITIRRCLGLDLGYICDRAKWLCLLPGWSESKGVRAEIATALAIGIPIVEYETGLAVNPDLVYEYAEEPCTR